MTDDQYLQFRLLLGDLREAAIDYAYGQNGEYAPVKDAEEALVTFVVELPAVNYQGEVERDHTPTGEVCWCGYWEDGDFVHPETPRYE